MQTSNAQRRSEAAPITPTGLYYFHHGGQAMHGCATCHQTKISFGWLSSRRSCNATRHPNSFDENKMTPTDDPRKRPLLTPAQLDTLRRVPEKKRKGTPREEFEKLFRRM
jgi:hypothetical protein